MKPMVGVVGYIGTAFRVGASSSESARLLLDVQRFRNSDEFLIFASAEVALLI
jgi:hypothetical protein